MRRRFTLLSLLLVFTVCLIAPSPFAADVNPPSSTSTPPRYGLVVDENGKHWFTKPNGEKFLSLGINNISPAAWNPRANSDYYDAVKNQFGGDKDKWIEWAAKLLRDHGFNTFGCWSDPELKGDEIVHTPCLYVAAHGKDRCLEGLRPGFEQRARKRAQEILARYENRNAILGVFLDNEMPWFGRSGWDDLPTFTLLEFAFQQPASDPGREAALQFLKDRYKTPEAFVAAWGGSLSSWDELDADDLRDKLNDTTQKDRADFTRLAAKAFFEISTRVVRELLPGTLILGVRFAGRAPEPVIRECGAYCDVISFNNYQGSTKPNEELIAQYWIWGKRPLLITEYSWRAEVNQSGNPNTGGAGSVVKTQAERGANYRAYVEAMVKYPIILGAHWFEFADQSPQGRFDGENSNYGVVDIHNGLYDALLASMKATNTDVEKIHAESTLEAPTRIPEPPEVVFRPGQHPDRPPSVDLLAHEPIHPHTPFFAGDASAVVTRDGTDLVLAYDTGMEWGCGVSVFGPKSMAVGRGPAEATDLDGYSTVELDAEIPEGLRFELVVDEAGVAAPNEAQYGTGAGDDGESFTFLSKAGAGKRTVYTFDLHDLHVRTAWGNQNGRKRVDTNALKDFAIVLPGVQGKGILRIHSLKLTRSSADPAAPDPAVPSQNSTVSDPPTTGTSMEKKEYSRKISFSGYEWSVKRADIPVGPGKNLFSDRPEDVWVDDRGLHLTITPRDGKWWCTEVVLHRRSFGYGTYVFHTTGRVDLLDPLAVAGMFTWDNYGDAGGRWPFRELDIEFARWESAEDPRNVQFTVQPWDGEGTSHRFALDLSDDNTDLTLLFRWKEDRAEFEAYRGHHLPPELPADQLLSSWTYTGEYLQPPGRENVRINLWCFKGKPPLSGKPQKFTVSRFSFVPFE